MTERALDLDLVRNVLTPTSVRAADTADAGLGTLEVRFSPFNLWYEIDSYWEGNFLERTEKGAFAKTMKESRANIKPLYDHGFDPQIGNKVLGPVDDLREDTDSAVGVVPLFDTTYNRDLLPGLEAGSYGSSFRFRVIKDEWDEEPGVSEHNPKGIPERTIKEVRLFEFGPVTFPANPAATAGMRCGTDDYYERAAATSPQVKELLARTRAAQVGTPPVPEDQGAAAPADEPLTHSARLSRSLIVTGALRRLTTQEN